MVVSRVRQTAKNASARRIVLHAWEIFLLLNYDVITYPAKPQTATPYQQSHAWSHTNACIPSPTAYPNNSVERVINAALRQVRPWIKRYYYVVHPRELPISEILPAVQ